MAKQKTVTVINPDGQEAQVLPSAVKVYVRKGWTIKDEERKEGEELTESEQAQLDLAKQQSVDTAAESSKTDQAPGTSPADAPSDSVVVTGSGAAGQTTDTGSDVKKRR